MSDWNPQIRRGLLELCILSILERNAGHGYEIVTRLAVSPQLAAREGTVYPLLRRLRKQGLLSAYWEESEAGPPRQVYQLSPSGKARLSDLRRQWGELTVAVDNLVAGRNEVQGAM